MDCIGAGQLTIPTTRWLGRTTIAGACIAALTGASLGPVYNTTRDHGWRRGPPWIGPAPARSASRSPAHSAAPLGGEAVDYTETGFLMRQLGTACFIVVAYLTGMRPGEAAGLRSGCCPDPQPDSAGHTGRHLITSTVYKTARDAGGGLHHLGQPRGSRPRPGPRGHPAGPHGRIGTERFRGSLAWHIARRPGGLVSLAVQYGHLRTSVAAGYAARSRDGIHDLLDVETARATIDTGADLNAAPEDGLGISGPDARQAHQILANPHLAVYDNPHTLLMCVYKRNKALRHRGLKDTPSLDQCLQDSAPLLAVDQRRGRGVEFGCECLAGGVEGEQVGLVPAMLWTWPAPE